MRKVEIIAEAGINHAGRLDVAIMMVTLAKEAGADAVKFQTFDPGKLLAADHPDMAMLSKCALGRDAFRKLARHAEDVGIEFMSTPGDVDSLKFLVEEIGVKRIKIGSDDLTYRPLIEAAHASKLPLILSTGMGSPGEIEEALFDPTCKRGPVTLLHCVSLYPCPMDQANLEAMHTLRAMFGMPVGYSDHTQGSAVAWIAAAMGAVMIEKHLMPDPEIIAGPVPDHEVSITPSAFSKMVQQIRVIEQIAGDGSLARTNAELANIPKFRKGPDGRRAA